MSVQLLQEAEQPGQEEVEEETGVVKGGDEEKDNVEASKGENPLEKYMKMVLEARERERRQVSCKQF